MRITLFIVSFILMTSLAFADGIHRDDPFRADYTYSCTSAGGTGVCNNAAGNASSPTGFANIGTCNISGVNGTVNFDIEGSVDNSNWDDLYADITANGNYSFVNQPFFYIRVQIDDANDSGTATFECITGRQ